MRIFLDSLALGQLYSKGLREFNYPLRMSAWKFAVRGRSD